MMTTTTTMMMMIIVLRGAFSCWWLYNKAQQVDIGLLLHSNLQPKV